MDAVTDATAATAAPAAAPAAAPVAAPGADPAASGQDTVPAALNIVQPVIAKPGQYYRNTRYVMSVLTILMGFWFGYDGFVRWPAEHEKVTQLTAQLAAHEDPVVRTELKSLSDHTDTDIELQRVLAFALPPLGICLLVWALYNSRGEYRLAEDTLFVPSHPPVPLASVKELDQSHWDRKGIARLTYELIDGRKGVLKLDDFVYDRHPTDKIYEYVKAHLQLQHVEEPAPPPVEPPQSQPGAVS